MVGKRVGGSKEMVWLALGLAARLVAAAEMPQLGPAPAPFEAAWRAIRQQDSISRSSRAAKAGNDSGWSALAVNTQSREAVRRFFNSYYLASENVSIQWTGNTERCDPGTTAQAFRDAMLLRIDYYRAMAGVPANVVFTDERNRMAQEAALMLSANNAISRNPPVTWACYTEDGAEAISGSGLFLNVCGPEAIRGYVFDYGSDNYKVAHRRFLFYPQTRFLGTGDIPATGNHPAANVTWSYDENYFGLRPSTRDGFVAWPPPGFIPYQIVYPRWSFSYPGADFSAASVAMRWASVNVSVRLEPIKNGYGDNTLVWIPADMDQYVTTWRPWPVPTSDTTYTVMIQNVLIDNVRRDFTYAVTIMDPNVALPAVRVLPGNPVLNGERVSLDIELENYPAGASFQLEKLTQWPMQWQRDSSAIFQVLVPNTWIRAVTTLDTGPICFYRVRMN